MHRGGVRRAGRTEKAKAMRGERENKSIKGTGLREWKLSYRDGDY